MAEEDSDNPVKKVWAGSIPRALQSASWRKLPQWTGTHWFRNKGHQQTHSVLVIEHEGQRESGSSGRFLTSLLLFDPRSAFPATTDFRRTALGLKTLLCAPVSSHRAVPTNFLVQMLDFGRVKGTVVGSSLEMHWSSPQNSWMLFGVKNNAGHWEITSSKTGSWHYHL